MLIFVIPVSVGVIIVVLGQVFIRLCLDPIVELRKTIGEVAFALIFYANVDGPLTTPEDIEAKRTFLRDKASRLWAVSQAIPLYCPFCLVRLIPSRSNIREASTQLIGLSNYRGDDPTAKHNCEESIRKALFLPPL